MWKISILIVAFSCGGFIANGDVLTLNNGEMLMGVVSRYENGVFSGHFDGSDRTAFSTGSVRRISFSAGRQGTLTTISGKTGAFQMSAFEDGQFVCMKSPIETSSIQVERIRSATFTMVAPRPVAPVPAASSSGTYTSSSWTGSSSSSHSSSSSSFTSHSSCSGGRVWVDGYRRADGTWVEGHWREPAGSGTTTYSGYHGGSTYVNGYRRKDGTYVKGHWRH